MEDIDYSLVGCALIVLALIIGGCYISYRAGSIHERRVLTMELVAQTSDIYYEGRGDAERDCREGLIK